MTAQIRTIKDDYRPLIYTDYMDEMNVLESAKFSKLTQKESQKI